MKLDKALGKHMSTFRALNAALTADTRIATEKLVYLLSKQPDTKEDVETAAFWIRTVLPYKPTASGVPSPNPPSPPSRLGSNPSIDGTP
jgi:hypothetical protein